MDDFLFPVGSIVEVENTDDEPCNYLIIGHRVINHLSMKAWDYISVPYPQGFTRHFKPNKDFEHDEFFYFNHYEIEKSIYKCDVITKEEEED